MNGPTARHDDTVLDLLVIGGGINGAGIARDAAGRGLAVALCEQADFGGATSSASTKLIHGGLRYLEHREFRLVAEALRERERLLEIAPHITRPLRFVMPHVPSLRPRWMIRLGMWLYDHIGGPISLPRSQALTLGGASGPAGLKPTLTRGFAYSDVAVDDARLVILNLESARRHGARIFPRTRLEAVDARDGIWHCTLRDLSSDTVVTLHARTLVNAAGPWVAEMDHRIAGQEGTSRARVKLVRGSHIVIPRWYDGDHAYILQNDDRRIVFMIPYEDRYTLIGTTDAPQADMSAPPAISDEEEAYLLRAVNAYVQRPVTAQDIVWRYAGVRPLFDDEADDPSAITRDYTLVATDIAGAGCVSVYGGKITTYRRLAESVLDKLAPWIQAPRGPWTQSEALPGGEFPRADRAATLSRLQSQYAGLPPDTVAALFNRHGLRTAELLGSVRTTPDLGRDFGGGLYECEAQYLRAHEWAATADDILWRRTKCGLHMTPVQRDDFSRWFEGSDTPATA